MSKPIFRKEQVDAAIARTAQKFSATTVGKSLEQEVTERADQLVGKQLLVFLAQRDIKIVPTSMRQATEMIYPLLKDSFRIWSHEELLTLVSFQNAIIASHNLSPELI